MKIEVNTAVKTLHFSWEWSWTIRLWERLCRWHRWISHNLSPLLMFRDVILPFAEAQQELLSWSPSLLVSQSACRLQQRLYLWLNISHESQWSTVLTVGRDMTCIWLLASLCFASQQKKKKKKRSCTGALSEWAHFLQRSCHMAVNYAFGGAAGSMRSTPALPVNSIWYHRCLRGESVEWKPVWPLARFQWGKPECGSQDVTVPSQEDMSMRISLDIRCY